MKYQIHQQSLTELERTILVAEGDPSEVGLQDDDQECLRIFLRNWLDEVRKRTPLKDGYQWLIADENSEYFIIPLGVF